MRTVSEGKMDIKRETVLLPHSYGKPVPLHRWVVRYPDTSLCGYTSTWWAAWCMACVAVGYRVKP